MRHPEKAVLRYARGEKIKSPERLSHHLAKCERCSDMFAFVQTVTTALREDGKRAKERPSIEAILKKEPLETQDAEEVIARYGTRNPPKVRVNEVTLHYHWYVENLCTQQIFDPRGNRVRFFRTQFLRLLEIKNKFGGEPGDRRGILKKIEAGEFRSRAGELGNGFASQARQTLASALPRTKELSWLKSIATAPDAIFSDWRIPYWLPPRKDREAYVKNFGTTDRPSYRVMICKVNGSNRDVITVFSRRPIGKSELERQEYPIPRRPTW